MRVRSVVLFPLLLTTACFGCDKSPRERLEGKWIGEGVAQVHPSQAGRAEAWVKQAHVEFNGSNVTVAIPAEEPRSGTFKIAKAEGNEMDVVFKRKGSGGEDRSKMTLIEEDQLRWTLGNGVELMLRKEL